MKKQMFEELLDSVREARSNCARREKAFAANCNPLFQRSDNSRAHQPVAVGVCAFDRVSVKTLQNWEQERRRPTGPAAALLSIIEHDPALAVKAIHRV
jgi:putative transcriptional regulator